MASVRLPQHGGQRPASWGESASFGDFACPSGMVLNGTNASGSLNSSAEAACVAALAVPAARPWLTGTVSLHGTVGSAAACAAQSLGLLAASLAALAWLLAWWLLSHPWAVVFCSWCLIGKYLAA